MQLMHFKNLIKQRCGLSFEDSREQILSEGIKTRLHELKLSSFRAYLNLLFSDPLELNRLVNLITVNETYFFREPDHFRVLTERLLPSLLTEIKDRKISIVSAGCSTGEEPYSIAIALAEKFGPGFASMFSITGFDIDEKALESARCGLYSDRSFRGVPDRIRKIYFNGQDNGLRINSAIRSSVEFLRLNIFGDSYPRHLGCADVIFYRNVSIYFEPGEQRDIFSKLSGIMSDSGYLLLGSAETFAHNTGILSLIEDEGVFLYKRGHEVVMAEKRKQRRPEIRPMTSKKSMAPAAGLSLKHPLPPSTPDEAEGMFERALELAHEKKYADALKLAEKIISLHPAFGRAHMLQAGIHLNLQQFDEAETICLMSIESDPLCLEGHMLLGMIARIRGDFGQARKRFSDAVYVRSSCWLAHFYLGELHRLEGNIQNSCREFDIVINLLKDRNYSDHGLTFFPLPFPVEQVMHLCRHNLACMMQGKS